MEVFDRASVHIHHGRMPVAHNDLRLVSRQGLEFAKALRSAGITVSLGEDDGRPTAFYSRKGIDEFFKDPMVIYVALPTTIQLVTNVLSGLVLHWQALRGTKPSQATPRVVVHGRRTPDSDEITVDVFGQDASPEFVSEIIAAVRTGHPPLTEAPPPPDPSRPAPIRLEHTNQIVAWGNLQRTRGGWEIVNARLVSEDAFRRMQTGELNSFSIGGIATKAICMICHDDYVSCDHVAGRYYDGKRCLVDIAGFSVREVSLVGNPVNRECVATLYLPDENDPVLLPREGKGEAEQQSVVVSRELQEDKSKGE